MTEVKPILTRKGDPMAFTTLEDKVGAAEVIFFPKVYAPLRFTLKVGGLYMIEGKLSTQDEETKVMAERLWKLEDLLPRYQERMKDRHQQTEDRRVFIKVTKAHEVTNKMLQLERLLLKYPGTIPVYIHYTDTNITKQLSAKYNVSASLEFVKEVGRLLGANSIFVKGD
jgi:DNA polymerase-3 subunit alpha